MNFYLWSRKSISQKLANFSFLALFPGFFFYHFAIARGFIPPVLGGYFGVVATFLLCPLMVMYFKVYSIDLKCKESFLFGIILIYSAVVIVINYVMYTPRGYVEEMFIWSLSGLIFNFVAFLIGAQINFEKINRIATLLFVLMFFIVAFNVGDEGIFYVRLESVNDSSVATYQGFARSIVFTSLMLTGIFIQKPISLFLIFSVSIAALFFNGARTEFIVYIFSSLIMIIVFSMKSVENIIAMIFSLVGIFLFVNYFADIMPQSRMMQLIDLQDSSSFESRYELSSFGLNLIGNNPLAGGYGMYVDLGGVGSIPHNLLSAWVNLGILGFSLYLVLFIFLAREAFLGFNKKSNNVAYRYFIIFLAFTVISVIFSKDYTYMAVGFLVGLFVNYKKTNN